MSERSMFISRLTLRREAGALGALVAVLRDGLDPGRAHRLLWSLFAGESDRPRDFLFRQGSGPRSPDGDFLVVSQRAPQDGVGLWQIETKPYDPALQTGQRLSFKMRVNPTVTREGKRHDVVMDRKKQLGRARDVSNAEIWEEAGRGWLASRAERLGFELVDCRADGYRVHRLRRGEGIARVSVAILDLSGRIVVRDPVRLRTVLFDGVGHGKAWGCGLMLVKAG